MILALHLLIMQATTWVLVPSNTLLNPLWVAATKATLFRGLLHINAAMRFGKMHYMWWQPLSLQSCQSQPFLRNSFSTVWPPLITYQWRGLTVWGCNLLGMVMFPSAMDMTRGTITLLKFLYSTIYIYVCVCVCV